jgi:hypothetical protein
VAIFDGIKCTRALVGAELAGNGKYLRVQQRASRDFVKSSMSSSGSWSNYFVGAYNDRFAGLHFIVLAKREILRKIHITTRRSPRETNASAVGAGRQRGLCVMISPELLRRQSNVVPAQDRTRYSHSAIRKLARSIEENGFPGSAVLDDQGYVVGGWDLVFAALHLGCEVPVKTLSDALRADSFPIGTCSDWYGSIR